MTRRLPGLARGRAALSRSLSLSLCTSLCLSVPLCASLSFSLFLFLSVSLCVSLCLSVSLCVSLCLSVSLCVSLCRSVSLCVSLCLSLFLCVSLFFSFSLCLSVSLSFSLSLCVSLCLSVSLCVSLCLSLFLFLSVSLCVSLCLSVSLSLSLGSVSSPARTLFRTPAQLCVSGTARLLSNGAGTTRGFKKALDHGRHPSLLPVAAASSRRSGQVRRHTWPGDVWHPKDFILLFVLVHNGDLHQAKDHHHCLPSWELGPTVYLGHGDRAALVDMPGHGGQLPEEDAQDRCGKKRSHLFEISVHNTRSSTGTSRISDAPFPKIMYIQIGLDYVIVVFLAYKPSIPQVDSNVGELDIKT